jgi:hypothetical protein
MYLALITSDDSNMIAGLIGVLLVLGLGIWGKFSTDKNKKAEKHRLDGMTPSERSSVQAEKQFGVLNSAMVCPHCQTKGGIRTKSVEKKAGVSGGKATAAVLTGGVSILATGLSRKDNVTQCHCEECNNRWIF